MTEQSQQLHQQLLQTNQQRQELQQRFDALAADHKSSQQQTAQLRTTSQRLAAQLQEAETVHSTNKQEVAHLSTQAKQAQDRATELHQ